MSESSEDASQRKGENRRDPSSTVGQFVPARGSESRSLLDWLSYLTILHLLYLVWRETSGRSPIGERI